MVLTIINTKRIFLCLLFFSVVFIAAGVSFAANNTTIYVNTGGNDSWDGSSPTHTLGNIGPKQHIISGLEASGNTGEVYIAAGTYKESELTVTKNLTIIGEGKTNTTVNAEGNNLVFWIKPGTIVTIKNLNITGGTASKDDPFDRNGGGIYNEGTLTLDNCIFYNNKAKDASDADITNKASSAGNGGAIYNKGTLTINNCEFSNNHAGQGGDASVFYNGSSGGSGGAIYNLGIITNLQACTFKNNYAGRGGESSGFLSGKAGGSGGAIYNTGTINIIQDCTFTTNHAGNGGIALDYAYGNIGGSGGAIYSNKTVTVNNSIFNGNYAGDGGDASSSNMEGKNGGDGGAICNTGTFTITNSEISNNNAGKGADGNGGSTEGNGGNGGAIYNTGTFTIINCEIRNNTVGKRGTRDSDDLHRQDGDDGYGGGIYNNATLIINNSKIQDNSAENGGGIYTNGNTSLTNTSFTNNTAQYRIIYIYVGLSILPSEIIGGEAGAVWNNGNLTLMNNTFTNNTALYGGALYYTGNRSYSVLNCSFDNNTVEAVDDNGNPMQTVTYTITGGWKVFVSAIIKSIQKTMLISKISPVQGITSIVGDIVGVNNMINPNQDDVEAAGGAIYMIKSINLTVSNCAFTNNTASLGAGICNFGNGTLTITSSEFIGNAAGVGGAVYSNDLGPLSVTDSLFNGNCAHGGAAIGYTGSESSQWGGLTVQENIFSNNDASLGGAVYDNFQGNTHIYMNFNRIYGTENYDIYNDVGKADARFNWWDSNYGPGVYETSTCNIIVEPYMVLTIDSPNVYTGDSSIISFDMLHDNTGVYQNPAYGKVPDGIPVNLNVTSGIIAPSIITLMNGIASTTYTANGDTGPVTISAIVDNNVHYPISSTFTVNKIPTVTHNVYSQYSGAVGSTITLNAIVKDAYNNPVNEGNVIFEIGNTQIMASVINGNAVVNWTITSNFIPGYVYNIYTTYNGTMKYSNSTDPYQSELYLHSATSVSNLYLTSILIKRTNLNLPIRVGDLLTFIIKVGNRGWDTIHNVVMRCPLPDEFEFVSASVDAGTFSFNGRELIWNLGDVPAGDPYLWLNLLVVKEGKYQINPILSAGSPVEVNNQNTVNAKTTKTIGMQKTGIPLTGIVLAILLVLGGLVGRKR